MLATVSFVGLSYHNRSFKEGDAGNERFLRHSRRFDNQGTPGG
jgi:hypothetical protein